MRGQSKRSAMVKNITPGLVECGKIKIGKKGETRESKNGNSFQLPEKLDHFLVTKLERDDNNNFKIDLDIHKKLGDNPKRIPVRLLYDSIELNFQSRYACFAGRTLCCSGDGENADRINSKTGEISEVSCPCEMVEPEFKGKHKCKLNGVLSVMLDDGKGVGGVWKFRTTSYNSIQGIMSSLTLIKSLTRGFLAGIPLDLTLNPKTVTIPGTTKQQTIQVVSFEYRGNLATLHKESIRIVGENKNHLLQMKEIESEAKLLLSSENAVLAEDEQGDIVDEFYPDPENEVKPEPKKTTKKATKKKVKEKVEELPEHPEKTEPEPAQEPELENENETEIEDLGDLF